MGDIEIAFEEQPGGGGKLTARDGTDVVGWLRWRLDTAGDRLYDFAYVIPGRERQGVGTALRRAARDSREAAGLGWSHVPTTQAGTAWVADHIERDLDGVDSRKDTARG